MIRLSLGEVVPADLRLIEATGLECNESILTGESMGSEKSSQPVPADAELAECTDLAFMGTIVSGSACVSSPRAGSIGRDSRSDGGIAIQRAGTRSDVADIPRIVRGRPERARRGTLRCYRQHLSR